jgi:ribosome maturation factor RimP
MAMSPALIGKISTWLEPKLKEDNLYLVDVKLIANRIQIFIDGLENVTIDKCVEASRFVETYLDKEAGVADNYALEVSSPGMTSPLKVYQQYVKRIGMDINIVKSDGIVVEGKIVAADTESVTIEIAQPPVNKKDKNATQAPVESVTLSYVDIKKALLQFNFK